MKLLRYGSPSDPQLGALSSDETIVSLAPLADRFPTMLAVIAGGEEALRAVQACVEQCATTI